MTAFMLWMSGSGLNIFTILFTAMALWNPIKSILAVNQGTVCAHRRPSRVRVRRSELRCLRSI